MNNHSTTPVSRVIDQIVLDVCPGGRNPHCRQCHEFVLVLGDCQGLPWLVGVHQTQPPCWQTPTNHAGDFNPHTGEFNSPTSNYADLAERVTDDHSPRN